MGNRLRRVGALVGAVAALAAVPAARAAGPLGNYDDKTYLLHDGDNVTRSFARESGNVANPAWDAALASKGAQAWIALQQRQAGDLLHGRIHGTLQQVIPGGAVGDPLAPTAAESGARVVEFVSRTGARLNGRIWGATPGVAKPGIVITDGSIQGSQHMYWWAARSLAAAGYVVLTFDVQGEGESETFGHEFGTGKQTDDGVPFQQEANFTEGTIDALRFFLSDAAHPYVPAPRTPAQVAAERARQAGTGEVSDWYNPLASSLDHTRIGIVGHSLGAFAVSKVQQCSDLGTVWQTEPLCGGTSFPIKAVVGWDSLSSEGITPVVPGMDQHADGYFLNPQPSTTPPDPTGHLAPLEAWKAAGIDAYSFTVRGGCHTEWTDIPLIAFGTSYGQAMANHYTVAWFDRYVRGIPAAATTLIAGPKDGTQPWSAHGFSANYLGGFAIHDAGGQLVDSGPDLRAYGGQSEVGDWAGANADTWGAFIP